MPPLLLHMQLHFKLHRLGSAIIHCSTALHWTSCSAQYIAGLCPAAGPPSKVSSRQVDRKAMLTTVSALAAILGITVRML